MKRREVKTFVLLSLPIAAILGVAGLASLRNIKREVGPPYRIVRHELIVGATKLTDEQKKRAREVGLTPNNAVFYMAEVESRVPTFWEEKIWGDQRSLASVNGSSCVEIKTGLSIPPPRSSTETGMSGDKQLDRMEDIYSLDALKMAQGLVKFSLPLTWREQGKMRSRTLSRVVDPGKLGGA